MTDLRLVLARHGQTDANVRRELDSRPPGAPLNELGRAQAEALAQRLADAPVTAVHASRALRAQQTAAPVAAAHGLPVAVVDGVQEVFVGDLEGRSDVAAGGSSTSSTRGGGAASSTGACPAASPRWTCAPGTCPRSSTSSTAHAARWCW
jgi:hypothetical protein